MTLLTPLGLLGLLGIAVLILIYILRPNYQQKTISSTHVWKLSLKYKKKKIPISKLRNFLLILCQILILTACATILAQPNKVLQAQTEEPEVVFVIDSSVSMRVEMNEETRFEKAVKGVLQRMEDVFDKNGICTVIVADDEPAFLERRVSAEKRDAALASVSALLTEDMACSYGEENIDGAMTLASEVLVENPDAQVVVYTDTAYAFVPEEIELVNVADSGEWNAAILSAEAKYDEGYYTFFLDVAVYGNRDMDVDVKLRIYGMNAQDSSDDTMSDVDFTTSVYCDYETTKKVVFVPEILYNNDPTYYDEYFDEIYKFSEGDEVYAYQSIHISLHEDGNEDVLLVDSLNVDNYFDIYNGQKEVLKVQYSSTLPNKFIPAMLSALAKEHEEQWDIQVTRVKQGAQPAVEGFDWYIFEDFSGRASTMPAEMPKDGVVMLINPLSSPVRSGLNNPRETAAGRELYFEQEDAHPILNGVTADNLFVTRYVNVNYNAYETLMSAGGIPMVSYKNEPTEKIVVFGFSLQYSNLVANPVDFTYLINNIFQYFFPSTVQKNAFEVNETVALQARGEELIVTGGDNKEEIFDQFPATLRVSIPGTYTLQQAVPFKTEDVIEKIFVKAPSSESDIFKEGETILNPYTIKEETKFFEDLLLYVAAALVALLFLEWFLAGRDNNG